MQEASACQAETPTGRHRELPRVGFNQHGMLTACSNMMERANKKTDNAIQRPSEIYTIPTVRVGFLVGGRAHASDYFAIRPGPKTSAGAKFDSFATTLPTRIASEVRPPSRVDGSRMWQTRDLHDR